MADDKLQEVMNAIQQTMEIIANHEGPIPVEVYEDIEKLKLIAKEYKENVLAVYKKHGINIRELQDELLNSPDVRQSTKQAILQARDIELEARVIDRALTKAKKKRKSTDQSDKKKIKERKKMFKSIGGDQNWIKT